MFIDCNNVYEARKLFSIDSTATFDEIKSKHKELVMKYHPDKYSENIGKDLCTEAIKCINIAYKILKDFDNQNTLMFKSCCHQANENDTTASTKRKYDETNEVPEKRARYDNKPLPIKWFSGECHFKIHAPYSVKISNREIRDKKSVKISFYSLNEDCIKIDIPSFEENQINPLIKAFSLNNQISYKEVRFYGYEHSISVVQFEILRENMKTIRAIIELVINLFKISKNGGCFLRGVLNHDSFFSSNLY